MAQDSSDCAVYVYNKTKETFVATEATVADSYFPRLIGLLGKTKRWAQHGKGLWIVPSRGVHTLGMLFPIDLIFLSKDKEVVHLEEYVRPFRISKVSLKATSVLELPAHTIYRSRTQVGDKLEIARLHKKQQQELRLEPSFAAAPRAEGSEAKT
ncbi:MAG TPA: DUF192 domain-containing protein [Candidatus Acidoferrales bacterium]|nr:DUF192 domain-containing protein [Candidatus Acidoferrales bacterium]